MKTLYLSLAIALASGFAPLLAGEIIFEQGIEYSSPGDEHLQLMLTIGYLLASLFYFLPPIFSPI